MRTAAKSFSWSLSARWPSRQPSTTTSAVENASASFCGGSFLSSSASGFGSSVYSINWLEWKARRWCSDRWNSMQAQLIEPAIIRQRFRDGPKFEQLGKRLVGLFGGGQFDHLPERGGFLAADGRQFAETVARVLFQNPQRVATRDAGMLAGVAAQHDAKVLPFGQIKQLGHAF